MTHHFLLSPTVPGSSFGTEGTDPLPRPSGAVRFLSRAVPGPPGALSLFWAGEAVCWSFVCKRNSVTSPHSCVDEGSGLPPRTTWHKTDHCSQERLFLSSPYLQSDSTCPRTTLEGQLSLGTGVGGHPGSLARGGEAVASGIVSRLLEAFEGELAPVGRVGARRATGVGAVGWSRVFGGI